MRKSWILCALLTCCQSTPLKPTNAVFAVIQTVSHPSLDASREGYIAHLRTSFGNNIEVIVQNGDGMVSHLQTIAQSLHHRTDIKAFMAVGTPAALAMSQAETVRPVAVTAVTSAAQLGLDKARTNLCGVSDGVDVEAQMAFFTTLLPQVRKVAILYSTTEPNSALLADAMAIALQRQGVRSEHVVATSDAEIIPATHRAAQVADAIVAPSDNLIASAASIVAKIALDARRPFFAGFDPAVRQGALAAWGVDYYSSGARAGAIVHRILQEGLAPNTLPIEGIMSPHAYVNRGTAKALGLQVPEALLPRIVWVD